MVSVMVRLACKLVSLKLVFKQLFIYFVVPAITVIFFCCEWKRKIVNKFILLKNS